MSRDFVRREIEKQRAKKRKLELQAKDAEQFGEEDLAESYRLAAAVCQEKIDEIRDGGEEFPVKRRR